jgi:uncharacterized protein
MTRKEIVEHRRAEILALAGKHGARNVRLFGSTVRDEAGPESDVDVLVAMEKGRSLLDLIGFELDLEDLLQCKVDVVDDGGLSPYLRDAILAEARPL